MKTLRLTWIAALLVCLLPAFAIADETERVHKVVPLGPGGTLSLHNFSGDVRIVGADVSEVTIDAVRTATRDRLDHIKLDIQSSGSTVTIDANKKDSDWTEKNNNVVKTEFDIQVPRDDRPRGGRVQQRRARARRVREAVDQDLLRDGRPAGRRGPGDVQDVLGRRHREDVGVPPRTSISRRSRATSTSACRTARKASLSFDSFSGKLTADVPLTLQEQRKGHLRADLNGGDPQRPVRLKTFSGDVKVGK